MTESFTPLILDNVEFTFIPVGIVNGSPFLL